MTIIYFGVVNLFVLHASDNSYCFIYLVMGPGAYLSNRE